MHIDRWKDILDHINEAFEVEDQGVFKSEEHGGTSTEFIVFSSPMGKMKLEFVSKPRVEDKKTTYSNRIGSDVAIDYIYSKTEKVHTLFVYKWSDADDRWIPIDTNSFNL
ncbi:MAG: hypothetical protein ABIG10_02995 [bacterium]